MAKPSLGYQRCNALQFCQEACHREAMMDRKAGETMGRKDFQCYYRSYHAFHWTPAKIHFLNPIALYPTDYQNAIILVLLDEILVLC
eukprot:Gb_31071 [translate_table: standard]